MQDPDKQFADDLRREDDVGLVLRGHLHVEHQLMELASMFLPFADRCDWGRFSFRSKVELAYACGMPGDLKDLLERLGTLRNDFAHKLGASLSQRATLDLYNSLSKRLGDGLRGSYQAMGKGALSSPSSLEPRDLLILIFLTARQATKAAVVRLQNAKA